MMIDNRHLYLNKQAVISHFVFKPPLVALAELKQEACFIFPINTNGTIYRPDGTTPVNAGQGALMRCGQYVNKWETRQRDQVAEVVILRLKPDILQALLSSDVQKTMAKVRADTPRLTAVVDINELLRNFLDSLMFYFDNPSLVSDELVLLKIKELTLLLLKTGTDTPIHELLFQLFEPARFELRDIVDRHVFSALSLTELASLANMSLSTFKRKFKLLFGESPGAYINARRLQKAAELLATTQATVADIAYDCGFTDPNYFSKCFRNAYQESPSEHRGRLLAT